MTVRGQMFPSPQSIRSPLAQVSPVCCLGTKMLHQYVNELYLPQQPDLSSTTNKAIQQHRLCRMPQKFISAPHSEGHQVHLRPCSDIEVHLKPVSERLSGPSQTHIPSDTQVHLKPCSKRHSSLIWTHVLRDTQVYLRPCSER